MTGTCIYILQLCQLATPTPAYPVLYPTWASNWRVMIPSCPLSNHQFAGTTMQHQFNSLAPVRLDCNFKFVIFLHTVVTTMCKKITNLLSDIYLERPPALNATGPHWRCQHWLMQWLGSVRQQGLVPSGNKPLHEPMLTMWCDAT